jgi:argininosuccinate lyase
MPVREAHGVVATLVRSALDKGKRLSELEAAEVSAAAPELDESYFEVLREGAWLESKVSEGGTSLPRVRDQLAQARHLLEETAG